MRTTTSRWFVGTLLVLLAACGGGGGGGLPGGGEDGGGDDGGGGALPLDPLTLAADVSEAELAQTILDLQQLGTRYTFSNGDNQARAYLVGRLQAYGFTVEEDAFTVSGEPVANVIARLPGDENPDVVYVFSAHYDSTSNQRDTDAPGADDNASGVAAVLEAARLLAPLALRNSVWFVLTAAEEQGAKGAEHLVQQLVADGTDVRGVMAPDMIGYWPLGDADALDILGDPASEQLVDQMVGVALALGVTHKKWIDHTYCYGDDQTIFQEAGFPALTLMDCVEAHNVPASGESVPHYHRTTDTLATLHMPFTAKAVGVMVASLALWAEPIAVP